nr:hypothetical protein [Kribbella pratensis]
MSRTRPGDFGPSGNQARNGADHSSSAFAGSITTSAVPAIEVHSLCFGFEKDTLTCGFAPISPTLSDSAYAKNQRSPSNSTSWTAIGRATC